MLLKGADRCWQPLRILQSGHRQVLAVNCCVLPAVLLLLQVLLVRCLMLLPGSTLHEASLVPVLRQRTVRARPRVTAAPSTTQAATVAGPLAYAIGGCTTAAQQAQRAEACSSPAGPPAASACSACCLCIARAGLRVQGSIAASARCVRT